MKKTAIKQATKPIVLQNAQRRVRFDLCRLSEFAEEAWAVCDSADGGSVKWPATPISVVIVSDAKMSALHWKFMSVRGPTDVITFRHGEIIISAETARRQARQFGTDLMHELQLYLVHGLLHLRGFDDRRPADAQRMARRQEQILRQVKRRQGV